MKLAALLVGTLLTFSLAGMAGADTEALHNLQARLAPLENLSAGFRQQVLAADGYRIQQAEGSLTVARPGKLRWRSNPPYDQLVVSDAEQLWLYDPDLEQVTIKPFHKDISRTPAILFIGEVADLEHHYQVLESREGSEALFTLIPADPSSLYEKVELRFAGSGPVAMRLWDSLGQVTRIELFDVVVNGPLAADLFQFVPPPGVDILRDD